MAGRPQPDPRVEPLVLVQVRREQEEGEVGNGERDEQPVEVLQVAAVDVGGEPAAVAAAFVSGEPDHGGHQEAGDVVADGDGGAVERGAQGAHAVGHLLVEELDLAHGEEHLGEAQDPDLRHQVEGADGELRHRVVQEARGFGHSPPMVLHQRGREHGGDGDGQARADSVERAQTLGMSCTRADARIV